MSFYHKRQISGASNVAAITHRLINASVWFTVEPWPENEWVITVKQEFGATVDRYIEDLQAMGLTVSSR